MRIFLTLAVALGCGLLVGCVETSTPDDATEAKIARLADELAELRTGHGEQKKQLEKQVKEFETENQNLKKRIDQIESIQQEFEFKNVDIAASTINHEVEVKFDKPVVPGTEVYAIPRYLDLKNNRPRATTQLFYRVEATTQADPRVVKVKLSWHITDGDCGSCGGGNTSVTLMARVKSPK